MAEQMIPRDFQVAVRTPDSVVIKLEIGERTAIMIGIVTVVVATVITKKFSR